MKKQIPLLMIVSLALVQACSLDGPELKPENPQSAPYKVQIYNEIDQQCNKGRH